eukprot:CAMPEP_0170453266 /NCGR_PEP_ID=MMETSP0123-20130129/1899_1 /TAXON_ID=182087 /ORGANISM="Favella ehrenbergii, Strain Fehren 1" /LENGTH=55 /DNA_ID=CAMNT_0010715569 /DNA_START=777 /DNA_END=941 /DNA_ORIENTATION=-
MKDADEADRELQAKEAEAEAARVAAGAAPLTDLKTMPTFKDRVMVEKDESEEQKW